MPMRHFVNNRVTAAWLAAMLLSALIYACGGGDVTVPESTKAAPPPTVPPRARWFRNCRTPRNWTVVSEASGQNSPRRIIAVGDRRWAAVLFDDSGTLKFPILRAASYFYPDGVEGSAPREGPIQEFTARYHAFRWALVEYTLRSWSSTVWATGLSRRPSRRPTVRRGWSRSVSLFSNRRRR